MAKKSRSAGRDAFHAVWLLALAVPLLCAVPYAVMVLVFALAGASERGGGAGLAVLLCGTVTVLGLAVPVVSTVATARRGYRIAPLAVGLAGPALAAAVLAVLAR
ncbi:hypothetical protein K353_04003 [Kitasatospora sp. SolWspMP-SS2h]|uniref:hypothetical protein n=1 Tax=Kitasatospora sp. SolWspMP-SS2h TaxID=1305729 RepID=UPI000DBAC62C|nr:hypothetical protein [Kitasatospora sp. SolWspMP-SS2h]RAJ38903.1 hypothetical protein K353_04003 [Kitasatospora sp. SolWspMP-SS2h]